MDTQCDITQHMLRYREAVRHNWNSYFYDADDVMGSDIQDDFERVEQGLFHAVVLSACGMPEIKASQGRLPLPYITVMPRPEHLGNVFLQIGERSQTGGMAWNPSTCFQTNENTKLEFIRFFDWTPYEQISLATVEIQITHWDGLTELVGSHALVDVKDVRFLLETS